VVTVTSGDNAIAENIRSLPVILAVMLQIFFLL
jgi:hypothetical protein